MLIGIDGRPCSGKTTLATALSDALHAKVLSLDEFFIPKADWPSGIRPGFPFPYFRYGEFQDCLRKLASGETVTYFPYGFETCALASQPVKHEPTETLIVEGVSVLNSSLRSFYTHGIFVKSDLATELQAIQARERPNNLPDWTSLFLPSVDIYFESYGSGQPDIVYEGRGLSSQFPPDLSVILDALELQT